MSRLPLTHREPRRIMAHRDGRPITIGRFTAEVRALADALPRHGFVINLCRDRYVFTRAFAAAIVAGQTNLLPANRLEATIDEVLKRYPDAYVLSDDDRDRRYAAAVDPRRIAPPGESTAGTMPRIAADQVAAIVFTSGSTGRSKAIDKPWRTFFDSSLINAAEMDLATDSAAATAHVVATVPPQHMYGLETSVLLPLLGGVAASNAQPFTPADIATALRALPAPRLLISTPAHLRALAAPGIDLPGLAAVWSATGPLDPAIAADIEARYGTRVSEIYGCSEVGSMARRQPVRDDIWTLFEGLSLAAEEGGTRASAAHLPQSFQLQDRLEHVGPGRFRVIGRSEDMVNVAGKRASLADLNQSLLRIDGIDDGVIFEPPPRPGRRTERLAALVVAPGLDTAAIRGALRERIDEAFLPRPIHLVDRLPRAETGKLPRQAVLDTFATLETNRSW